MSAKRPQLGKLLPLVFLSALVLSLLLAAAQPVLAAGVTRYVRQGGTDAGNCLSSQAPCGSISYAVSRAGPGDTILVYPGTYSESVDLKTMLTEGNITLRTVDNQATYSVHTATVNGGGSPAFHTSSKHAGDVTIVGFVVNSTGDDGIYLDVNSDVVVRSVAASGTGNDGIRVYTASGDVEISDCVANSNHRDGIYVGDWPVAGTVTVGGCTANHNGEVGIEVANVSGPGVFVTGCNANGNGTHGIELFATWQSATVQDCTTSKNGTDGIHVEELNVDGVVENCTSNDNGAAGIHFWCVGGWVHPPQTDVTIGNCTVGGNATGIYAHDIDADLTVARSMVRDSQGDGVALGTNLAAWHAYRVNESMIWGSAGAGLSLNTDVYVDATGNWWGHSSGPRHPGNPPGLGDAVTDGDNGGLGTVDYTPWIDRIIVSAPVSAMIEEQVAVTFQFTSGAQMSPQPSAAAAVFLGIGPGDLRGPAPFTLTTDNGVLVDSDETGVTVEEFIHNPHGVLAVTLVPGSGGTATVRLDGPRGLDAIARLEAVEFVPEAGTVLLLGSGLMGLAGYAGLRLRKR